MYAQPDGIIRKLGELPRSQRLRKAAKIFGEAEQKLLQSAVLTADETERLGRTAELLSKDEKFSPQAAEALAKAARLLLEPAGIAAALPASGEKDPALIRRNLNTVYYILLEETGRNRADWDFIESTGGLDASKRSLFPGMYVYLEDIRSPFNVGSMFRTAESFGAEKIWLSPLCADPRHKRAERTAMGCVDVISWERLPADPFDEFAKSGQNLSSAQASVFPEGRLFALETGGTPLGDFSFPACGILIAGSEELGVSPSALAAADASLGRVSIPTYGAKGSLNVSIAFGIVMQAWSEARKKCVKLTHSMP